MAIAGGAKPSVAMQVVNNVLELGRVEMRQGAVNDVDLAVHRLLLGETVFVQQFGPLVTQVQKTVEMTLGRKVSG